MFCLHKAFKMLVYISLYLCFSSQIFVVPSISFSLHYSFHCLFLSVFYILHSPLPHKCSSIITFHIHSRVPGPVNSTFSSLPPAPSPAPAPNPESSTHSWVPAAGDGGRLSSDEGDTEAAEDIDRPAFHCSSHHPQPLAVSIIAANAALMEIS